MPQQVTVTAYKFAELTDKAKDQAHNSWLRHHDNPWSDDNRKSLEEFCSVFPAKANDWSYDSCNGDIRMQCDADDTIAELKGLRLRTYLLNNYGRYLYAPRTTYYTKREDGTRHMNSVGVNSFTHTSKIIIERKACPFTGYCMDDSLMNPIHAFVAAPVASTTMKDLMQQCGDSWIDACVKDMEYSMSLEFLEEEAEANDYLFTEAGSRCASL